MKTWDSLLQIRVLLRQNLEGNSLGQVVLPGPGMGIFIREAERGQKKKGDDL